MNNIRKSFKLLLIFPWSQLVWRQEAVTQYDEKKPEPFDPPADTEVKEHSLLQRRSLHSQSTGGGRGPPLSNKDKFILGSTETVVEASPIGKKGQSIKKRPENLDIGASAIGIAYWRLKKISETDI